MQARDSAGQDKAKGLATLRRGLAVLEFLADADYECTATDISEALGISKGVCYHVLRTLVSDGYLVRTHRGAFQFGPRFSALFDKYQEQLKPSEELIHILHALRAETKESCYITGWQNRLISVLYYVEGEGAVRVRRTAVGSSDHVHARATARAILAFLPERELGRYLHPQTLLKLTPRTVVDPAELVRLLRQIRKTALSIEEEEFAVGVACMGSPVLNDRGVPVAAIGMSVALNVYQERFDELAHAVHSSAELASRKAGWAGQYPTFTNGSFTHRK